MKKIYKFSVLFIFIFLLFGCNKSSSYEVVLEGSSNSYYNWTYEIEDTSIVKVIDEKYFGQESEDNVDGLDGEYKFKFEALAPGKTKVNFKYARAWEETDVLYEYSIELEVNDKLKINKVSESGNYLSLAKFLKYDIEKLGLSENFDEYKLIFDYNVVTIEEKECDFLTVYDYNEEIVGVYGISRVDSSIYKLDNNVMVVVE